MRREDVERLAVATLCAALLGADYLPGNALAEAQRMWSEIYEASLSGLASEEDSRADYCQLLGNHFAIGLSRGLEPEAALAFAKTATSVLLSEIDGGGT